MAFVPVADLLFVDAGSFLVSSGCLVLIRGSFNAARLGSLAGAAAINLSGSVIGVYAVIGGLTAALALAFPFSPVAHGDRYLAEVPG